MVYWRVVQLTPGVYLIQQHGALPSGRVHHLTVTHVWDLLAQDIAQQAAQVLNTRAGLLVCERVAEAMRTIDSRQELDRHARDYGRRSE